MELNSNACLCLCPLQEKIIFFLAIIVQKYCSMSACLLYEINPSRIISYKNFKNKTLLSNRNISMAILFAPDKKADRH
jgi:hypothetical protein